MCVCLAPQRSPTPLRKGLLLPFSKELRGLVWRGLKKKAPEATAVVASAVAERVVEHVQSGRTVRAAGRNLKERVADLAE